MASGGQPAESLSLKVWELKVAIHCAGCQKKIKKILNHIEGVIETEINASQSRVTVKGIVDSEVLIKKLAKHGKNAQLFSQPKPSANQTKTIPELSKESPETPEKPTETAESTAVANTGEKSKEEPQPKPSEKTVATEEKGTEESKGAEDEKAEKKVISEAAKEPEKAEAKETKDAAEKPEKKQKETKGEVSAKSLDGSGDGKQEKLELQPVYRQYHQPVYMQEPQLSYNIVQPSVSNAYYYASPMEAESRGQEYGYSSGYYHHHGEPSMEGNENMNMFSEENPNACNLM